MIDETISDSSPDMPDYLMAVGSGAMTFKQNWMTVVDFDFLVHANS